MSKFTVVYLLFISALLAVIFESIGAKEGKDREAVVADGTCDKDDPLCKLAETTGAKAGKVDTGADVTKESGKTKTKPSTKKKAKKAKQFRRESEAEDRDEDWDADSDGGRHRGVKRDEKPGFIRTVLNMIKQWTSGMPMLAMFVEMAIGWLTLQGWI